MTYRDEVLADNPSHYWPLSEPGGTVVADIIDPSGTGVSVNNAAGYRGITATDGAALINNSNNNAFLGLKNKLYATPPCTFEAWVWLFGALGTYSEVLMYGDNVHDLELNVQASMHVNFNSRGGTGVLASTGILTPGSWHHLVGLASLAALTLYIDGALDAGPLAATYSIPATDPFGFGGFTDRTQPVNGYIASPALYPTVLSAARILAHYNSAETKAAAPAFQGGASAQQVTTLAADVGAKLDAILAAVKKVF